EREAWRSWRRPVPFRLAAARFPGLGGAEEDVVGVEHGEHEATPAVEESAAQEVHRHETPQGAEGEIGEADARAPLDQLGGGQCRVAVGARDQSVYAAASVVHERLAP